MINYEDYLPQQHFLDDCDVSATGDIAYVDRSPGIYSLFVRRSGESDAIQLTDWQDRAVRSVRWHPDGKSVYFTADENGSEMCAIYRADVTSGDVSQVSGDAKMRVSSLASGFSPNGELLAYAANIPDPANVNIWLYDATTGENRHLFHHEGTLAACQWSADGRYLAAFDVKHNGHLIPVVVDVAEGKIAASAGNDDGIGRAIAPLTNDNLLLTSSLNSQQQRLVQADLTAGTEDVLNDSDWDVEAAVVDAAVETIVWVENVDGYSTLMAMDLATRKPLPLPQMPRGVVSAMQLSANGNYLCVIHSRADQPADIYLMDLCAGTVEKITNNTTKKPTPQPLIDCDVVRFASADGTQVPANVFKPTVPSPYSDGSYPVVIAIHGGPNAQERPEYQPFYQTLLAHGVGVIAPNVRGSTGYGLDYMSAVAGKWGTVDLEDFEATHTYAAGLDWVRADRVGVYGGSYGGFATLSCLTRLPDLWACGVDIVGPSNLVTFVESVPESWAPFMPKFAGDINTDRDGMIERSPVTHAHKLTAPIMIIQGAHDPRVVQAESDQFVAKLRENGTDVRYDVYEDEGHGFVRAENAVKCFNDVTEFLTEHLLKA